MDRDSKGVPSSQAGKKQKMRPQPHYSIYTLSVDALSRGVQGSLLSVLRKILEQVGFRFHGFRRFRHPIQAVGGANVTPMALRP